MTVSINYLAVVVAAVVAFILGAIWNGPLFGKAWAAARGLPPAQGEAARPSPGTMAIIFVALLIAAWAFAVLAGYVHLATWLKGLKLGAIGWFGFMLPVMLIDHVMNSGRKVAALCIGAGSWLVSCVVMGIIVAVWH